MYVRLPRTEDRVQAGGAVYRTDLGGGTISMIKVW